MFVRIDLVARDAARGIHRDYQIQVARDLLGGLDVTVRWGLTGAGGYRRVLHVADAAAALRVVRTLLRRRERSRDRDGIPYRVVLAEGVDGLGPLPLLDRPAARPS